MYLQADLSLFVKGTLLCSSSEPGKSLKHRIVIMRRDDVLVGNGMDIVTNVLKHCCGCSLVCLLHADMNHLVVVASELPKLLLYL